MALILYVFAVARHAPPSSNEVLFGLGEIEQPTSGKLKVPIESQDEYGLHVLFDSTKEAPSSGEEGTESTDGICVEGVE